MLRRRGPSHLRVLRLPHGPGAGPGLSLASLLDAADLFVAAGQELTAVNPAVVALARGVPIITTITDSAADLVVPGRDGHLVDARPDAVAEAVLAHLDGGGLALRRRPRTAWGPPVQDLARGLLHAYADARSWPASWRPAAGR
jgi:glycosyltransferase involved in cell wall biosynthesis